MASFEAEQNPRIDISVLPLRAFVASEQGRAESVGCGRSRSGIRARFRLLGCDEGEGTFDELDRPRSYIPRTKMTFSGLQSPRQRAN